MAADPAVVTAREGRVTTVTINRPEVRNAVDRPTAEALTEAFLALDADEEADVAVLGGAGGTFCAGADLAAISSGRGNRVEPDGQAPMGPTRLLLSKPVIAAVSGFAVAGGLELAAAMDREFGIGTASLEQAVAGAAEFAAGRGRHGRMGGA